MSKERIKTWVKKHPDEIVEMIMQDRPLFAQILAGDSFFQFETNPKDELDWQERVGYIKGLKA